MRGTGGVAAPPGTDASDVGAPAIGTPDPTEPHDLPPAGGTEPDTKPRLQALARLEILDGLRSRRQLALRTFTPIALFLIVLGVTLVTRTAPGTRSDPYVVAVQGDLAGAQGTLTGFNTDRLRFVPSQDATLDAARGADIGMLVPDRLDDRLARNEPAEVTLLETTLASESRSAAAFIRAGFGSQHEKEVIDAVRKTDPSQRTDLITIDSIDIQRSVQAAQFQTSSLVVALVLLQASMLVGSTATRLLSRNNRGLLASQLLLPFERWRLALSKGVAELSLGTVAAIPILIIVTVGSAWTGFSRDGWLAAILIPIVVLSTFLVLALAMTSIGLLLGTKCRTQEQVSLASAVVVVFAAVIASQIALNGAPPNLVSRILPIVGATQSATFTTLGYNAQGGWLLLGFATTILFSLALVRWAGRGFNAERLVLRDSA